MKSALSYKFSWKWLAQEVGLSGLYLALALLGSIATVAQGKTPVVWPASGLAIARKAAERMHGAVRFESTLGKGSCSRLELRAA